jgi:hypothetical protein
MAATQAGMILGTAGYMYDLIDVIRSAAHDVERPIFYGVEW